MPQSIWEMPKYTFGDVIWHQNVGPVLFCPEILALLFGPKLYLQNFCRNLFVWKKILLKFRIQNI